MKVTGEVIFREITEEHPGSIKGQFTGRVTYVERSGKLKIKISKSDFLHLMLSSDSELSDRFFDEIGAHGFNQNSIEIEEEDFDLEVVSEREAN
jgi:hypothetical protein